MTISARGLGELAGLLRRRTHDIVDEWSVVVRARGLPDGVELPALIDHVPAVLEAVADSLDAAAVGRSAMPPRHEAGVHAVQRLRHGYGLPDVLAEYAALRRCVVERALRELPTVDPAALAILHAGIDEAVALTTSRFLEVRERVMSAIERITSVAIGVVDIDELLRTILGALVASSEVFDAAAFLLLEGDRLRARASYGFDDAPELARSTAVGEGFAGRVAAERRAMLRCDGRSASTFGDDLRLVYGLPFLHGARVLGVVLVASRSVDSVPDELQFLLRITATRVSAALVRAQSARRERVVAAVARVLASSSTFDEAMPRLLETVGESFGWESGGFLRYEHGVLRTHARWRSPNATNLDAFDEESWARSFHHGRGLPGRVLASTRVEWISDVTTDPDFPRHDAALRTGLRSAIAFPLRSGERVIGVVEYYSKSLGAPAEDIVALADALASQISEFVRRLELQDETRRLEALRTSAFDVALDAIVSMNGAGIVTDWNPAAERTFGFSRDEAIGSVLAERIIPEAFRDAHRRGLARHLATGERRLLGRRLEMRALRKDGTEFPVELTITRVAGTDAPAFIGFVRDITDRKRAEEDLRAAAVENAALAEAAREAVRHRDDVLAVVAHDLRNPLGAIHVSAAALLRAAPDGDRGFRVRKLSETILRSSERMERLIGDLLDLATIRAGRLTIETAAVPAMDIVADAVETMQPLLDERGIGFVVEASGALPRVRCDRDRVLQALSNLLGNAVKVTPRGGLITIGASLQGDHVCFSVRDTGPGIGEDDLARLFDRYVRGQGAGYKGTGLGLAIARGIIEAHGGRIWAESAPGAGARFRFTLPIADGSAGA